MELKRYRKMKGMTQAALAAKIGVRQSEISHYENGRTPRREILVRIINVTRGAVSANDFIYRYSPTRKGKKYD